MYPYWFIRVLILSTLEIQSFLSALFICMHYVDKCLWITGDLMTIKEKKSSQLQLQLKLLKMFSKIWLLEEFLKGDMNYYLAAKPGDPSLYTFLNLFSITPPLWFHTQTLEGSSNWVQTPKQSLMDVGYERQSRKKKQCIFPNHRWPTISCNSLVNK